MIRIFQAVLTSLLAVALSGALLAEQLCVTQNVALGPDNRMLGHLPYAEAPPSALVPAPAGFAIGQPCLVHRNVAADLARMIVAARAAGAELRGLSCFRSIARQRAVFCSQIGPGKACNNAAERAMIVGPPGFSEHATGYAIDFGTRQAPACGDVSACFADTPAGRWMIAHAPEFGFELSFPAGNAQRVTWEPWHWRWVGVSILRTGADHARALFARARRDFPALPTTPDSLRFPVAAMPSMAFYLNDTPPPLATPSALLQLPAPPRLDRRRR